VSRVWPAPIGVLSWARAPPALAVTNHHDRDLVTPAHENHPLSPQRGERVRVRGVYFHGKNKKISLRLCVFARDILVAPIRIRGILRLSSAACRQLPENSRTFPPFEKGGSGGISHDERGVMGDFYRNFSALLLSYCHKNKKISLRLCAFAPLRLCVSARDILVAAIRISP
jgi:hypothetical protein